MTTSTEQATPADEQPGPFQFVMLVLSVYVLVALFVETVMKLPPDVRTLLRNIDDGICMVFLADFAIRLARSRNRLRFLRWGWIDLISSIPTFDVLRWGRLIRVVRILRILRAFRSTKLLVGYLFRNRAQGTFATVALVSITLAIFASIAILNVEDAPESNIKSAGDALWWSLVTISTVGYGDKFPVTTGGRAIAVVLMTAGVGLFGTFTGLVASLFIAPEQKKEAAEIEEVLVELRAIREELKSLRSAAGSDGALG